MSYTRLKAVDFGPAKAGLSTVRYTIDGGTTWVSTGITENSLQPGFYSATITFSDMFTGILTWDTHEVSGSIRVSEEINPASDELTYTISQGETGISCKATVQAGSTASLLILAAADGFALSDVIDDYDGRLVKIVESTAAGRVGCDATAGGWNITTNALTLTRPFKSAPLAGDVVALY